MLHREKKGCVDHSLEVDKRSEPGPQLPTTTPIHSNYEPFKVRRIGRSTTVEQCSILADQGRFLNSFGLSKGGISWRP